jgi:transcription antitermination factor NusG
MNSAGRRSASCWYALTVKPQHEKAAAHVLRSKGLEEFVPLYRTRHRWSDRFKEVELPLFPGYVFCRFAVPQRTTVLTTPSVRSIVGFGKTPAPVAEEEIQAVQAMVSSGLPVGPWPFLKVGQRVCIKQGPLCGLEGILVQLKDAWRVVVNVHLLQRSVAAEIDRDTVEVASTARHWQETSSPDLHVCPQT